MTEMDFTLYHINNFTVKEITDTGAKLQDVQAQTFVSLQRLRNFLNRPIYLINNGITTGKHKAIEHKQGKAVDCFLSPKDGKINSTLVVEFALMSNFVGVGVYYNSQIKNYSFHFDLRERPKFWGGVKVKTKQNWVYFPLMFDPKDLSGRRRYG